SIQQNLNMETNINLNGNSINEGSDERLKINVVKRKTDDLNTIMKIVYVDFDYANGNTDKRRFIAQQIESLDPGLITKDERGYLSYDTTLYTHTIGHAVQQLALREENTNLLASENRSLIEELQEENKELRNR